MNDPGGSDIGVDDRDSCYVINLYTWIRDPATAADLAIRIAETVAGVREIDHYATTVSQEEDPTAQPTRVYRDRGAALLPRVD